MDKDNAEKQAVDQMDSDANLPDTSSDSEDKQQDNTDKGVRHQAEYEAWKVRELKRILRDREEVEKYEEELAEVERRRKMTDAERELENTRLGTDHN